MCFFPTIALAPRNGGKTEEEAVPTTPFEGKGKPSPARTAPEAATCGVVYQNAHRRLACQFTFACDGIPDIVREKGPWMRAQKIAKQALDSQNCLPAVAKATHYHATYVKPRWIRR